MATSWKLSRKKTAAARTATGCTSQRRRKRATESAPRCAGCGNPTLTTPADFFDQSSEIFVGKKFDFDAAGRAAFLHAHFRSECLLKLFLIGGNLRIGRNTPVPADVDDPGGGFHRTDAPVLPQGFFEQFLPLRFRHAGDHPRGSGRNFS